MDILENNYLRIVFISMLEVDGNISILSTDACKKTTRRRKAYKIISKQQSESIISPF